MKPLRLLARLAPALVLGLVPGSLLAARHAQAQPAPSVYGRWLTDDRSGVVEVAPCGAALCGTLVRVLNPAAPARDINNPDPRLRDHPLVGTRILTGLKPADGHWRGGRAYDPKVGRSYRASVALGGPARLDVTGCVLFLCQTRHWTRVAEEAGL